MNKSIQRYLLTLYTRTPLHVGSGSSVDVVDLPIMRERITGFPVIPSTSLKGVLLQRARDIWGDPCKVEVPEQAKVLFGGVDFVPNGNETKQISYAGCVQIQEARILAFPVRSLAGCFAWLTCPTVLRRFQRDTGQTFPIPMPERDRVIAGRELVVNKQVILEEYALELQDTLAAVKPGATRHKQTPDQEEPSQAEPSGKTEDNPLLGQLIKLCPDPLWTSTLFSRLAVVHDENFQYFVTACTEVVARIAINPETRTVKGSADEGGGALFNQENVPSETLFYSVLTILPPRRPRSHASETGTENDPGKLLGQLLSEDGPVILQIGGDETTGHGLCLAQLINPTGGKP